MVKTLLLSCLAFLLGATAVHGQDRAIKPDSLRRSKVGFRQERPVDAAGRKRLERDHYRRTLGVDSAKSEQLLAVQSAYKEGVRRISADTSLNDAGKRAAVDLLILQKNRQLERLLTPAQQSRMIPTTERRGPSGESRGQH